MKRLSFLILLSATGIALFSACQNATDTKRTDIKIQESLLTPTFENHGSLEKWLEYNDLQFGLGLGPKEEFRLDLKSRHELITGEGYSLGFDGNQYWSDVRDTAVGDKNAKFLINLQFYFFAMPFVLGDDGVNLASMPDQEIAGKTFKVIKATFGTDVGVAPEDQYIVFVDPATRQMEYLLYSVTYFNPDNAEKYGALHYHTWQEVGGLKLPHKATRYSWNSEEQMLGDARGEKVFSQVRLSKEKPDPSTFAPPK